MAKQKPTSFNLPPPPPIGGVPTSSVKPEFLIKGTPAGFFIGAQSIEDVNPFTEGTFEHFNWVQWHSPTGLASKNRPGSVTSIAASQVQTNIEIAWKRRNK